MTTHDVERSPGRLATGLLLVLPCGVVVLSIIVWVVAVSRSGFWADDFLNVTYYAHTLGNLSDVHVDAGQYIINLFWALGATAFGAGSAAPFLILNSLVLAVGLAMWLWVGTKTSWSHIDAWWICGLFIATAAWFQTALWSSNITHSGGFFALGVAMFANRRAMTSETMRACIFWCIASGLAWLFAIMSNILYVGLLVIAVYCTWRQIDKLLRFKVQATTAAAVVGFWNLLLPIAFFLAVVYPARIAKSAYAKPGLQFVHANLRYYRSILAPTDLLTAVYAALLIGGIVGAIAAVRRCRDFFPVTVLSAAGATALPALVQSQQREIHYMAMPLLLLFSALAAGIQPVLLSESRRLKVAVLTVAALSLSLLFRQGADIRAYFVQSPYGSSLATFRSEVASLTPEGGSICAKLVLSPTQETAFLAEMSGEDGFYVPPISASHVYFATDTRPCPTSGVNTSPITVSVNARDDFVASR